VSEQQPGAALASSVPFLCAGRDPAQQGALWGLAPRGLTTARCMVQLDWICKRQSLMRLKRYQVGELRCGH